MKLRPVIKRHDGQQKWLRRFKKVLTVVGYGMMIYAVFWVIRFLLRLAT